MVVVTTTTTSTATVTATAPLLTSPTSLPSSPEPTSSHTSPKESIDSPDAAMPAFTPGQCLFCPISSPSFPDSVVHMQKSHGLFVPHQQHLVVELEALFRYLHLIVYGYRECIRCGTQRATVQGVQQHMTGKGHCKFDIVEEDSEFAEFYDFSEPEDVDVRSDSEGDDDDDGGGRSQEDTTTGSRKPQVVDEDSIRLPSGKIISRQSPAQAGPSLTQARRRTRNPTSRLDYTAEDDDDDDDDEGESSKERPDPDLPDTQVLSKREKRERAAVKYQLANMSANDRNSLLHLPASEQRAILATQHRQVEKDQQEERRRRTRVDRKGNKNLYAYWHTETPVYQCG